MKIPAYTSTIRLLTDVVVGSNQSQQWSISSSCVAEHECSGATGSKIRCYFQQMQNVLDFFRSFFQQITRLLKGGDNWFLVIDEAFVAQEISALQDKKYDNNKIQNLRQDDFNRQYELNRRLSKESITLGELWSTLSPFSIFRFLKYTLSDVV